MLDFSGTKIQWMPNMCESGCSMVKESTQGLLYVYVKRTELKNQLFSGWGQRPVTFSISFQKLTGQVHLVQSGEVMVIFWCLCLALVCRLTASEYGGSVVVP